VLATAKATASGQIMTSFAVPSGFAGSTIPGRKDTFQAKGRQSGTVASATFTGHRLTGSLAPTGGPSWGIQPGSDQTMLSGDMSPPPSNDPETASWKHLPCPGTPTSTGRAGDRPQFQ
jgi:hypothetical protein